MYEPINWPIKIERRFLLPGYFENSSIRITTKSTAVDAYRIIEVKITLIKYLVSNCIFLSSRFTIARNYYSANLYLLIKRSRETTNIYTKHALLGLTHLASLRNKIMDWPKKIDHC